MRAFPVALAVMAAPAALSAQLAGRATAGPPGEESAACSPDRAPCVFTDLQGENVYTIDKTQLRRTVRGEPAYAVSIAGGPLRLLLAAINKQRTQLVLASEHASVATTALLGGGGGFAPDAVQRQYWLSIRNPKSGEEIKPVNLGMLRPAALGLSASGDYVWVLGDELQLRRREIRAYNTRSGKLEHTATIDKGTPVRLYERGFQLASTYYAAEVQTSDAVRKHLSPNAYSIAEFTVRRSAGISPRTLGDAAIGVIGFQGGGAALRDMLDGALAIKLTSAGFRVVERARLKDLLQEAQFQNLGLTDATKAAELGRLVNARYLLFGVLETAGTVSTLALRLVGVEDGMLENGIELECRDCTADDYLQGLSFLMQDWLDGR
jgi:hypothetical protein